MTELWKSKDKIALKVDGGVRPGSHHVQVILRLPNGLTERIELNDFGDGVSVCGKMIGTESFYQEYDIWKFRIAILKRKFRDRHRRYGLSYVQIWKQKPVGTFTLIWQSK